MKTVNFLIMIFLFVVVACKSNKDKTPNLDSAKGASALVAGYYLDQDDTTALLLGPDGVKWSISKADIISKADWNHKYEAVDGQPKILEIKLGATIIDGDQVHIVKPVNAAEKSMGCNCEVSCGGGRFCCAISGFKTECSGSSCVQTNEKC